jgi:ankyrin repeat protein
LIHYSIQKELLNKSIDNIINIIIIKDIQHYLIQFLPYTSLLSFSLVNKDFHNSVIDPLFYSSKKELLLNKSIVLFNGKSIDICNIDVFKNAIKCNAIIPVKILLENVDISYDKSYKYTQSEIVKLILKERINPSIDNNWPIRYASKYGYLGIVKLLLKDKRVDPSDVKDYAISHASENGHVEIVKLLLKDSKVNPSNLNNYSIKFACLNEHLNIVNLLLQDDRTILNNHKCVSVCKFIKNNTIVIELIAKQKTKQLYYFIK